MTDYTYNTGNPIGSTDVRDGVDNLKSFDVLLNSKDDTYQDRLGNTVPTATGAIKRLGPVVVSWTFTTGGTLNYPNEAALNPADGNYYGWTGALPKVVAPGADPTLPGSGYVPRTDVLLRSELSTGDGSLIQIKRPADSTTETFPKALNFYFKSAPINLTEALPGNFVTDGSVDYSAHVQKVCEYLKEYGGGKIIVPHNTVILVGNILSYANIEWFGNDWTSEILVKPGFYGLSVNKGSGGTVNPDDNARNCVFDGFRVRGQVETAGFSEHIHLINLNAVSAVTIQNMSVMGAQGDHVYLGSGNIGGLERHNEDVTIDRLFVDGINKDNRNGVSVVDCDGLKITNSRFKRVSRSDMPGAIDIEPNNYSFSIVKNILIEDIVVKDCDCGGAAVGAYVPPLPAEVLGNATNIRMNRINVQDAVNGIAASIVIRRDTPRQSPGDGCSITHVTAKNIKHPFKIEGVVDGVISDCSFEKSTEEAQVGNTYKPVRDLKIEKVSLVKCGTTALGGLKISNALGLELRGCKFVDCGDPITGGDIRFGAGASERVKLLGNYHDSPGQGNTRVTSADDGHVFIPGSNECIGNKYEGGKRQSTFPAYKTDESNLVANVFTADTPPSSFTKGRSVALWNSPAGTLPTGYTQGVCVTENVYNTIGMTQVTTQTFTPRGNGTQLNTFYRYASADGLSWGTWKKIVAVIA